jgi:hypothetical protein
MLSRDASWDIPLVKYHLKKISFFQSVLLSRMQRRNFNSAHVHDGGASCEALAELRGRDRQMISTTLPTISRFFFFKNFLSASKTRFKVWLDFGKGRWHKTHFA